MSNRLRQQLAHVVHQLNMGRESSEDSIVDQEMHRRALWTAYTVEQWLSAATSTRSGLVEQQPMWACGWPKLEDSQLYAVDRKCSAHHETLRAVLQPDEQPSVEAALQVTAFGEMIKLARIAHNSTTMPSDTKGLTEWLLQLPSYLQFGKTHEDGDDSPPSPVARVLHILYYTVQLLRDPTMVGPASTIIHIAEQMLQHHQQSHLANVVPIAVTLAASTQLAQARYANHHATIHLARSLRVVCSANCTPLSRTELERALMSYVLDLGILLDSQQLATTDTRSSSSPLQQYEPQEEQQQQQQQYHRPPTITAAASSSPSGTVAGAKRPCVTDDMDKTIKRPAFDFSRWLPPEQQQQPPSLDLTSDAWLPIMLNDSPSASSTSSFFSPGLSTTPADASPPSYFPSPPSKDLDCYYAFDASDFNPLV